VLVRVDLGRAAKALRVGYSYFKNRLNWAGYVLLACEEVVMVASGRDGSRPCFARISRKIISSPRRVAEDFWE
jgi:hypothetical protein